MTFDAFRLENNCYKMKKKTAFHNYVNFQQHKVMENVLCNFNTNHLNIYILNKNNKNYFDSFLRR